MLMVWLNHAVVDVVESLLHDVYSMWRKRIASSAKTVAMLTISLEAQDGITVTAQVADTFVVPRF